MKNTYNHQQKLKKTTTTRATMQVPTGILFENIF